MTLAQATREFRRAYVAELLSRHKPAKAAEIAGINRTHFYRLAHDLGVPCGKPRGTAMVRPHAPSADLLASRFVQGPA